ncbi:MAG TPA: hypothetical protein PKE63_00720 [Lacibacter sp.]|nr:hypothetical protein [Lacibacter sp.]HMO88325.1 hypothetical protein [Lacibacter sp.]HMP85765.1 hypothetical protein [Lacibacter sp.]
MALINKIEKGFKDRDSIHKPTECSYFIVYNKKGEKFLQLDTYGSADRAIPGKVSQSIQFSPEAIAQLKELLSKEF